MKRLLPTILALLIIGSVFALTIAWWHREYRFESSRWKRVAETRSHYRVRVVDELLVSHDLRGMTRDQIIILLGPPDKTQKTEPNNMVYWLGPQRYGFPIDDDWLVITFGDQKTAIKANTETD